MFPSLNLKFSEALRLIYKDNSNIQRLQSYLRCGSLVCQLGGHWEEQLHQSGPPCALPQTVRDFQQLSGKLQSFCFFLLDLIWSHGSQDGPRTPATGRLGLDVLRL